MSTINQLCLKHSREKKSFKVKTPAMSKNPQLKGVCMKVFVRTPKKPNSAVRIVAKVNLTNGFKITGRMPGIGYLCGKYNRVLANGGRANDLPGVSYTLIRGVFDFSPVIFKKKRRSIYGVSRPDGYTKHVKRSLRIVK